MTNPKPEFASGCAYVDEQMVPISEARIPIMDWGFLHSDATYDVAHVWKEKFFRLEDHLDRFQAGMAKLRMSIPHNREEIRSILSDCVRATGLKDAYVEMICTRGLPQPGSRDPRTCTNRFTAFAVPFIWIAGPRKQEQGLHLIISDIQRIRPQSIDPSVKNYHWLDMVMGLFQAYDRGGETVALVDGSGNLVEGPGFNLFALKDKTVVTPATGMLEGVTRRTAIELMGTLGYDVKQRDLPAEEARSAEEVFITSTAGGIMSVTQIDGRTVGNGKPGQATRRLHRAYWQLHDDPRYATAVGND